MKSAATQAPTPSLPPSASERDLLDILYEILTDETGEDFGVSPDTVQAFLHEHARSKQSEGALAAFFEKHKLSTRMQDYGRDPSLAAVPSGLHLAPLPPSVESPSLEDEPTPAAVRSPDAMLQSGLARTERRSGWLMPSLVTLGVLVGILGALATFNALNERELEQELSMERLQLRATGDAVDGLRAEANRLRDELNVQRGQELRLQSQVTDLLAAEAARRAQAEAEAAEVEARAQRRRWGRRREAVQGAAAGSSASALPSEGAFQ